MGTKQKKKVGFFDIDGTIFRSSLLIELLNGLVQAGVFPKEAGEEMEKDYLAWLNRKGSYDSYLDQVIKIYNRNIAGQKEEDINKMVEKVLEVEKDKVYCFTRDLVQNFKKEGIFLVAISGSPDFIVVPFARHMGFDACYGSVFEVTDGCFTGKAVNKDSCRDKQLVIERFTRDVDFTVDFAGSTAVGDSGGDISMLEAVGNPIAFNPDHVLVEYAKKEGWQIVVERKNVAYKIKDFKTNNY